MILLATYSVSGSAKKYDNCNNNLTLFILTLMSICAFIKMVFIQIFCFEIFSKSYWFIVVQAVYVLFRDDDQMKLPHFIAIAGLVCAMFAICIPHLSALGIWLGFSTVLSLAYIVIALVLSLKDGNVIWLVHHSYIFIDTHSINILWREENNSHV